ncbi:MAG: hypothetical protein RBS91_10935, partial [Sulfurimonadaceae bacterium]|nr:hypothetical protein [Sulfurimonadaceae bacterium]
MIELIVGYVVRQSGDITSISSEGIEKKLFIHMPVFAGDLIKAGADSSLVIVLENGNTLEINQNQTVILDSTVYEDPFQIDNIQASVESMQKAIENILNGVEDNVNMGETEAGERALGSSLIISDFSQHDENLGYAWAETLPTDNIIPASVTTTDDAGNSTTVTDSETYSVD